MKRTRRFFGVFVLMMVLFFTLIVVRVWAVKPSDETGMRAFEAANPEKCPSCGAQVFDPFGRRVVIHDVERCKSSNAI